MTNARCDTYFDGVEPEKWRFIDFYRYRQLQPDFSESFQKESFVLKRSLEYLLANGSEEAKKYAQSYLVLFKASVLSSSKFFFVFLLIYKIN